jgi:antitoxin YefM
MTIQTTYSQARTNLAALLNEVTSNHEIVIVQRRGAGSVAMIDAGELSSLLETVHLLRSPKNAERLTTALARIERRELTPQTPADLRKELKLDAVAPVRKKQKRRSVNPVPDLSLTQ